MDPWGSLSSQLSCLAKTQASEKTVSPDKAGSNYLMSCEVVLLAPYTHEHMAKSALAAHEYTFVSIQLLLNVLCEYVQS